MNILMGGKLGDFIHGLILPKYIYETQGIKSNVYICDHREETFASGVENSYKELLPVVQLQPYINHFSIYKNESIDIDLTTFRRKENLFTTSWNEFYLWNYVDPNIKIPFNYSWIETEYSEQFSDALLINRNMLPYGNESADSFYRNYIRGYEGKCFFVCAWPQQYYNFPLKDLVPVMHIPELKDMFTAINSCKHFIGNYTATSAIASALNKNRTIEVYSDEIRTKYIHEMKNYDNLICFQ